MIIFMLSLFFIFQPNGKGRQQCMIADKTRKSLEVEDYECDLEMGFVCQISRIQPPFSLRGLCPGVYIFNYLK